MAVAQLAAVAAAGCCQREGCEPAETFMRLLDARYAGMVRGPLNQEARLAAGFTPSELAALQAGVQAGRSKAMEDAG
ncbi:MAG: hypothetical protein ACREB3_17205 [Burkholderiales bacterium]